ncbi:MAG TPA: hypothetical protein VM619_10065 [Luteimonas sp.]|nr:hypothetical protein [Luteimonas sp.]
MRAIAPALVLPCAAALFAVALCAATPAAAADLLSGSYRPVGEQVAPEAPAPLRVQATGDGWIAWFEGQARPMQEMGDAGLSKLFPRGGRDVQCGATAALVFCHVAPGTPLPDSDALSSTGYFTADADGGIYELERQP